MKDEPAKRLGSGQLLMWLTAFKLAYFLAALLAITLWPKLDKDVFLHVHQRWPREGGPVFASHFATWDAAHYLYLSEVGYSPGIPSCAFYPLWPLCIRAFAVCLGGSHLASGLILSNLFSLAAWWLFYELVRRRFGGKTAFLALIFLISFPGALFFQFIYTESLFFLLLMLLWFALETDRSALCAASGFLLPITRAIGVFCCAPIAWRLMRGPAKRMIKSWRGCKVGPGFHEQISRSTAIGDFFQASLRAAPLLFSPILGWVLYLALMVVWTGDPFEGMRAQRFWGVQSIQNIINLPKFLDSLCTPTAFHELRGSWLDRILFVVVCWTVPLVWRTGTDMFAWLLVLAFLPALSGDLSSFTRFCAVAFPIFVGLAQYCSPACRRWIIPVYLVVCGILHAVLLWRFLNFHWAG